MVLVLRAGCVLGLHLYRWRVRGLRPLLCSPVYREPTTVKGKAGLLVNLKLWAVGLRWLLIRCRSLRLSVNVCGLSQIGSGAVA